MLSIESPLYISTAEMLLQVVHRFLYLLGMCSGDAVPVRHTKALERRARIQLGLVEMVGAQLVTTFLSGAEGRSPGHGGLEWSTPSIKVEGPSRRPDEWEGDKFEDESDHGESNPHNQDTDPRRRPSYSATPSASQSRPSDIANSEPPDAVITLKALRSEDVEGWWTYGLFGIMIALALLLERLPA